MSHSTSHPTPEQLRAFSAGALPAAERSSIESHVSDCQQCGETLLGLSADDTFVDLLREVGKDHSESAITVTPGRLGKPGISRVPEALVSHARYEVVESIGVGGMGEVFKAKHRVMNRVVALKVIHPHLFQRPEAVERFRREVQSAAQLVHPNIVTAYDAEQADQLHFLVMEHVDGVDLAALVKRSGALSVAEACEHIRQAALGLQYAHRRGMVHRDIKPHNLMRAHDGTTKILDFGLAMLVSKAVEAQDTRPVHSELTASGSIVGTPDFMAPEQATDARSSDTRSDIYSLGATFYFLLSGRPPFVAGGVAQKLQSHAEREPEPIESLCPETPPELAGVVRRMMAKNPADRFQTPAEVAEAIAPHACSAATRSKPAKEGGRWRSVIFAAMSVAPLLLVAGVLWVVTNNGTLVVNASDDGVEITIRKRGQDFRIVDTVTGATAIRLPNGEYTVSVADDQNDFKIDRDHFEMTRGGQVIVTVSSRQGGREVDDGVRRKETQIASIAAINELGGRMRFDKKNPALVTVTLSGERIRDAHLVHVQRLENIQSLYLSGTSVSNAGLETHIRHMKTLVNLYLPNTEVTDEGLRHLDGLSNLRVLYVNDLPITDHGLLHIVGLQDLAGLSLDRTRITDDGAAQHLSQLSNLKMLFLRGTKITDAGLRSLGALEQLHHLDLKDTAVTDEGVARFREVLPNCKVVH